MRARRETEERVIELLVMFERMSNEYRRAHARERVRHLSGLPRVGDRAGLAPRRSGAR